MVRVKRYGDEGVYTAGDGTKSLRVTALRSLIWPGAITVVKGSKYANLYVGSAMKCGTMVGPDKETGLPLRGTNPLMPLAQGHPATRPRVTRARWMRKRPSDEVQSRWVSLEQETVPLKTTSVYELRRLATSHP
ncbi:hypothetical protein AK812_SmicGene24717 [Symbiodinium microadriaticum]|uniref:Uncharacterized protein n=1 Tax=Symbiodinium microadriaticum TaxID=2951 RepID=A0A1Q9DDT6_SYMMI|nr:hypothetical protein AK812_SmicGene24717 [Symbiodinium microadriaticum]